MPSSTGNDGAGTRTQALSPELIRRPGARQPRAALSARPPWTGLLPASGRSVPQLTALLSTVLPLPPGVSLRLPFLKPQLSCYLSTLRHRTGERAARAGRAPAQPRCPARDVRPAGPGGAGHSVDPAVVPEEVLVSPCRASSPPFGHDCSSPCSAHFLVSPAAQPAPDFPQSSFTRPPRPCTIQPHRLSPSPTPGVPCG